MTELKQSEYNAFNITGTLKTKNLREDNFNGNDVILGNLVIEVSKGEKIHNHFVNIFASKLTKAGKENGYYKGYQTILNEYIAKDDDKENADYVEAKGSIDYNVYYSNGVPREQNRLQANSVRRVSKADNAPKAEANVTVITDKYSKEKVNGELTGNQSISAFTVGYGGRVNKLMNLMAEGEDFASMFPEHSTLDLTIELNNYAIVKEKEEKPKGKVFGKMKKVVPDKEFVNNIEIVGAEVSNDRYTRQDLQAMKKNIQEQLTEAATKAENKTKKSNKKSWSKGSNNEDPFANSGDQIDVSDDDLPF